MKTEKIHIAIISTICFILLIAPIASFASTLVTITGEVNDSFHIVDSEGEFYEIADTSKGSSLVEQHSDEKVKVTGTVEQDGDVKIITVEDYEALAE